eukprot:Hpha_TRINITY_DN16755_c1_g1::TRINITY_DN16755_c1_g1_i31::g.79562::m.79562
MKGSKLLPLALRRLVSGELNPAKFRQECDRCRLEELSPEVGYGKLHSDEKRRLKQGLAIIAETVVRREREVHSLGPRYLRQYVHECAKVRERSHLLFSAVASAATRKVDEFHPKDLSLTLWSVAKVRYDKPSAVELFNTAAKQVEAKVKLYNPKNISNTVWAYATMKHNADVLFNAVAKEAQGKKLGGFAAQALSNTVWAFSSLDHHNAELFDAVANEGVVRIKEFKPQALSNMVYAFAKVQHKADAFFNAVGQVAQGKKLGDFKAQEVANTVWAFATAGHHDQELFDAIANEGVVRIREFTPQNLSNMVWAFAKVQHKA